MDIIQKLIKDIAKMAAKIAFNKEEKSSENFDLGQIDSMDIFRMMFNKYFHEGDYNKTEDLIFNELENNNSSEVYSIALDFYNLLLKKSDEELLKSNFPREEIYHGLEDIKKFTKDLVVNF